MLIYKRNLALVNSRYGEMEHRLLDLFAQARVRQAQFDRSMDFEFMYLLQDGLLAKIQQRGGVFIGGARQGPETYVLTNEGIDFIDRLIEGRPVAE